MADCKERYEGNGNSHGNTDYGDASTQLKCSGFDDLGELGSKDHSRDFEGGSSKIRERDRDHETNRDFDMDRDLEKARPRDRDRTYRDHRDRDRSGRRDSHRSRDGDHDQHRSRDRDRHQDYDRGRENRQRHRSRSKGRSSHRSRSRSPSRSKSKRVSGFDMAPPAAASMSITTGVTVAGQAAAIGATPPPNPGMFPNMMNPMTSGQATRHARRVYVGGLSANANEQSVATYFSQVMSAIGGNTAGPGDAVVNVYINHEKKFAFVEMRSVEEASNAMSLDGIIFEGAPVKVRRPSDYNPSLAAALGPSQPNPDLNLAAVGLTNGSAVGLEGPDRVFVGGVPYYFTESQIRELLESFGPLKGFDLVKDRETGNSKGYAFCVYQDLAVTDVACAALNGIKMGDKTLTVRRANQASVQPRPDQESVLLQAQHQVAMQRVVYGAASKVVCLTQVVTPVELKDDDEYEDIVEDMRGEGGKYGLLLSVVIPRPGPNGELGPGVGKVFLEYGDTDGSAKAKAGLHGRKFGGNAVVAVFYQEDKFSQGLYDD